MDFEPGHEPDSHPVPAEMPLRHTAADELPPEEDETEEKTGFPWILLVLLAGSAAALAWILLARQEIRP